MSNVSNPVVIVQGGQWGSEAKGAVAAYLCLTRNIDYAVRTGAINAGHTVEYKGTKYAMQQIPTGWVNPDTRLVIGAGAYIHPDTLWREIDMINRAMPHLDVRNRLFIDFRCGIHDEAAESASKLANRHHRMGATGKGCSEAIVAKIRDRNNGYHLFADTGAGKDYLIRNGGGFHDTVDMLNKAIDAGQKVLIEGTQGTLLDLHLGPYPFTTSRMTSAANWMAECGLSPSLQCEVVLVCRTFPIRVAGNSGPIVGEIEWAELAREINTKLFHAEEPMLVDPGAIREFELRLHDAAAAAVTADRYKVPVRSFVREFHTTLSKWTDGERDTYRVAASELHRDALNMCSETTIEELRKLFEMTTVTRKLRRIARLNVEDLEYSVSINRPAWVFVTFMDYIEPMLAGYTADSIVSSAPDSKVRAAATRAHRWIKTLGSTLGVPVRGVSTGPRNVNYFNSLHLEPPRQSER